MSDDPDAAKPPRPSSSVEKWGKPVWDNGHTAIPAMLLRWQHVIDLTCVELCVLLQLIDHWWHKDSRPWPAKKTLATRLGLGERHVQRTIADLEKRGLVQRYGRRTEAGGKASNAYDLTGLVETLTAIAPAYVLERRRGQRWLIEEPKPPTRSPNK